MPTQNALLFARHIERRREQTDQALNELGYDTLLIHSGRPEMRLHDDQHPPFRAHAAFSAWIPQPFAADCLLELKVGQKPRLWFSQPDDFWHLPPATPEGWWADVLKVETVKDASDWRACLTGQGSLAVIGRQRDLGDWLGGADLNPERLIGRLNEHRTRKTAWERECLARANQVAVRAHRAAGRAFESGASELEIHLAYLAAAGQDQDELPYNSIVALNEHAAVLHYQFRSPDRPASARSFLIDAGAHHCGYAADVTRTWAAPEESDFDDLIDAVDRVQRQLCDEVRSGASFVELHRQAHLGIAGVLEQAGLVNMTPDEMVESGVSGYFLPHGLGHFLGMQVHDVAGQVSGDGKPLPPPEDYPALRLTRDLEPGNVLTIEPGVYFIPMLLEKLKGSSYANRVNWSAIKQMQPFGGIRIEDNVLVTEGDPVNFTRQSFSAGDGGIGSS